MPIKPDFKAVALVEANAARDRLAELTEWAPAGLMVRVVRILETETAFPLQTARTFAQDARAECETRAGADLCADMIRTLTKAMGAE